MIKNKLGFLLCIVFCVTLSFAQNTAGVSAGTISIEDFFRKPQQSGHALSPDGKCYIYRAPVNGINNIFIQEIGKEESAQLTYSADRDIMQFVWGNNDIVLFRQDTEGDENYKLYSVDIESREIKCLVDYENANVVILDIFGKEPDEIIVELNKRDPECYDVYRLNIRTGSLAMIEQNPGDVTGWMVDNDGVVRIAYSKNVLYRRSPADEFKKLNNNKEDDDTFLIHYFTSDNKSIYAYSNIGRDKIAIVEYDLDANKEVKVVFEDPLYDAFGDDERDYFEYSKSKQKLMYAEYTAEKRKPYFFDNELKSIYDTLKKKIGNYEIHFTSISDNYNRVIFYACSDRLEGTTYLFDRKKDSLQCIGNSTPWLNENELSEMKPIEYASKDGLTIHGYLTIPKKSKDKKLPLIVFPHAGPQWRNSWGFNEFVQFFADRGYAVLQVNFRGSEGYGKKFMKAGFKQWGLKMQDDITDGVEWLIQQGVADKNKIAIFGWSYGGYAALAGITFTPDLYACAVDLWGISNYFTFYNSFPQRWKPYLGEINRRWGDAVKDSLQMYQTSPVFHVKNIKAPVFIGQSVNDRRVVYQHSEQMVEELKKYNKEYEYVLLQGEGHALTNEKKLIDLMTKVEAFFDKHLNKKTPENLYLGQSPPNTNPKVFAPGIISTDMFEFGLTISPDLTELYFTRRPDYNGAENRIYVSRVTAEGLTKPVTADFAENCFEFLPSVSPDGRFLYFYSERPKPQSSKYDGNLWFCTKTENGWSKAEYLDNPANSRSSMTVSSTAKGVLYYSAISDKRLCVFRFSGEQSSAPKKLPDYINKYNPAHPFISPDESYLLFDSQINGMGKPELFVCYREKDGSWTEPVNMGPEINKTNNEFAASVSPDGKYLFFHRRTDGNGDIYWVSADIIRKLSEKN